MHKMIEWFTRNGVAANILMVSILGIGAYIAFDRMVLREWPDFPFRNINISVPYPGSTPSEVEESIVMRIEEAVFDVAGIEEMNAYAREGSAQVSLEIENGFDMGEVLDEVKDRIDGINTFPEEAERPRVTVPQFTERLITVVVSGDLNEFDLTRLGYEIRDEITNLPSITLAGLKVARPYEISIEVPEATLKRYGLTMQDVVQAIRNSSVNLSAGSIRTTSGDVLLRTSNQAYNYDDFSQIVVVTRDDGTRLTLNDLGVVEDGFNEMPIIANYNGKRCIVIDVFRTGDQNLIALSREVRDYLVVKEAELPEGISLEYWADDSQRVIGSLKTLGSSALLGFLLVICVLSLFLRPTLGFWVSLGIPVAFAGAFIPMYFMGVTINLITLFALILVLGIVVDDAIVTGENVFDQMQRGVNPTDAAIRGTQQVAVPVTFGILTTIVAFLPLYGMSGWFGNHLKQILLVVAPVLLFSLVESKLILPAHLKHCTNIGRKERKGLNRFSLMQRKIADGLESFVRVIYQPALDACLRHRYLTVTAFIGLLFVMISMVLTDRITWNMYPRIPRDQINMTLFMPAGTNFEVTKGHIDRMERIVLDYKKEINDQFGKEIIKNIFATSGGNPMGRGWGAAPIGIPERGEVVVELESAEVHGENFGVGDASATLRQRIGEIPGAERFQMGWWRGGNTALSMRFTGPSFDDLKDASARLKEHLETYDGLTEIQDSFESAKAEFELELKPQAEFLGITAGNLARQVRQAFYGAEAQRIQRGRDDIRVMVRYPLDERRTLDTLNSMMIRAPGGTEVPFDTVAAVIPGRSLPTIHRIDRQRQLTVSADAENDEVNSDAILAELERDFIPELIAGYTGMDYVLSGNAQQAQEDGQKIRFYTILVLALIYILLAIPLRSYFQPFIVMSVIPFGIVGAIFGHMIMDALRDYPITLNLMSVLGFLALGGVVVNDSLVMVHYINMKRGEGMVMLDAVRSAGARRFRPILLTSLTTFFGLLPLMFETSRQARWMIPMAISLGWGILFATFITLFLVPVNTLIQDDFKKIISRYWRWQTGDGKGDPGSADKTEQKEKAVEV